MTLCGLSDDACRIILAAQLERCVVVASFVAVVVVGVGGVVVIVVDGVVLLGIIGGASREVSCQRVGRPELRCFVCSDTRGRKR